MAFNETFNDITSKMVVLRQQMNATCKDSVKMLSDLMFAEYPDVGAMSWTQRLDLQNGLSIDDLVWIGAENVELIANGDLALLRLFSQPVTHGPQCVQEFGIFVHSLQYHLYSRYGFNKMVILSRAGIRVVAI